MTIAAPGKWLDMMTSGRMRPEIKKTVVEYIRDQWAWFWLPEEEKKWWIPPDWYRPMTDDEYRAHIKKEHGL